VLCSPAPVGSVPALSLEPVFRRSHGSLYRIVVNRGLDGAAARPRRSVFRVGGERSRNWRSESRDELRQLIKSHHMRTRTPAQRAAGGSRVAGNDDNRVFD